MGVRRQLYLEDDLEAANVRSEVRRLPVQRYVSYDDLERSGLLGEIVTELSRFSVGFVKIVERHGKEDVLLAGSGTLVQVHERVGILTADHVLQGLSSCGRQSDRRHRDTACLHVS
jgi:hypothetical protein